MVTFWVGLFALGGMPLTTNVVEVAFEEVGTMAASVAYAHVRIPIDLTSYRSHLINAFLNSIKTRDRLIDYVRGLNVGATARYINCMNRLKDHYPLFCTQDEHLNHLDQVLQCTCRTETEQRLFDRFNHMIRRFNAHRERTEVLLGLEASDHDDFDDFRRQRPIIKARNVAKSAINQFLEKNYGNRNSYAAGGVTTTPPTPDPEAAENKTEVAFLPVDALKSVMLAYKRYHKLKRAGKLNVKQEQVRNEAEEARKMAQDDSPLQDDPFDGTNAALLHQAVSFFGQHPELLLDDELANEENAPEMGFSPPMPPPSPPPFPEPPAPDSEPEATNLEPSFERNPATEMAHPPTQESSTTETQPPPPPEQTDRHEQPQDDQPAGEKPPPVEQTQMPFPISPSAPEPNPSPPAPEPNNPAPESGPSSSSRSRELKRAAERVRADLKQHHLSEEEKAKRLFRQLIDGGVPVGGTAPESLTSRLTRSQHREKRQIGLLVGLGAITGIVGTALGLYDLTKLNEIEDRVGAVEAETQLIIHNINEDRLQINLNAKNLAELANMTAEFIHFQLDEDEAQHAEAFGVEYFSTQIDNAAAMEREVQNLIEGASRHRVPVSLLTNHQLDQAFKDITNRAHTRQYEPIIDHAMGLLQVETSFLLKDGKLVFFAHVPLARKNNSMMLYRYAPLPLHVLSDKLILAEPRRDLIAISPDQKYFRALSSSELARCQHYNRYYVCPNHSIQAKDKNSTCVGALWIQDTKGIQTHCKLRLHPRKDMAHQLSANLFIMYIRKAINTNLACGNGSKPLFLENFHQQHIGPDCVLETNDLVLRGDMDLQEDVKVHKFPWLTAKRPFLHGKAHRRFDHMLDEMKDIGRHPNSLPELESMHTTRTVESTHTIWLWSLLGVSIALLLLGACLYRMFYKATRPKRPSASSIPAAAKVNVVVGSEAERQPFQAFNKKRTVE